MPWQPIEEAPAPADEVQIVARESGIQSLAPSRAPNMTAAEARATVGFDYSKRLLDGLLGHWCETLNPAMDYFLLPGDETDTLHLAAFSRCKFQWEKSNVIWLEWVQDKGLYEIRGNWSQNLSRDLVLSFCESAEVDDFGIAKIIWWNEPGNCEDSDRLEWYRRGAALHSV